MTGGAAAGGPSGRTAGTTLGAWRREAAARIAAQGPADATPALEADLLLMHALGVARTAVFAHPERRIGADALGTLTGLLERRLDGEPIAYLVGRREFLDRAFAVRPGVLVPRPETELLVALALEAIRERWPRDGPIAVLELGTGSGVVASSIAAALAADARDGRCAERPADAFVVATDIDPVALAVAAENAHAPHVPALARVDWLAAIGDASVDVLVSNPPYVAEADPHLAALAHEPRDALVSGADGLDAIRRIVAGAPRALRAGGALVLEHGHDQGDAVRALCARAGLVGAFTRADLAGLDRVSGARRGA